MIIYFKYQLILYRVMDPNAEFSKQLHLIYLVNDTVHHW